jgi:O-acetyl-ADP-ribose deacetylase (regulator of RNase III)
MLKQIPTIEGNLLDFPPYCKTERGSKNYTGINVIAHSCNCQNVMGGGIAKQIKDRYPQAFEADTERWSNEYNDGGNWRCQIGDYSKAEIKSNSVSGGLIFLPNNKGTIYNLYTQSGYSTKSRQVNYEYFWQALKNMQEDLLFIQHETGEPQVLGLPYAISCGLAGGNWGIIKAMIEDIFLDSLIKTYIVRFDLA